jgi:hypothetical protein
MELAVKQKKMKADNNMRAESLRCAIAEKEASLEKVKAMILERKQAAQNLRDLQAEAKKQRIAQCQQETEVSILLIRHIRPYNSLVGRRRKQQ